MVLVAGVFLPQAFFRKYADLGGLTCPDAYLARLQADTLFMIAVPMLIVGLAAVLLCPMMFPDETDYQVLTPLPRDTRGQCSARNSWRRRLPAASSCSPSTQSPSIWFPLVDRRPPRAPTRSGASRRPRGGRVAGSAWMLSAVTALQGVCLGAGPGPLAADRAQPDRQACCSSFCFSRCRFVARLPATSRRPVDHDAPRRRLRVWFYGVEQWLLHRVGGRLPARGSLAGTAAAGHRRSSCRSRTPWLYRSAEQLAGVSRAPHGRDCPARRSRSSWLELKRLLLQPPRPRCWPSSSTVWRAAASIRSCSLLIVGVGLGDSHRQVATVVDGATWPAAAARCRPRGLAAPLLAARSS